MRKQGVSRRSTAIALRRLRGPQALQRYVGTGGYEGARTDRAPLKEWTPSAQHPDADVEPDLKPLRARVRDLARNAPLIAGAIDTHMTSIVGPGLVPHPRIDREFLGLSDEAADRLKKQIVRVWWAIAGGVGLDIRRKRNFAHLSWVVLRGWLEGGEIFVRRRYAKRPGDVVGTKVQLIEADRVSTPEMMVESDTLIAGVQKDEDGAPTGYWVSKYYPDDPFKPAANEWTLQPAFGVAGDPLTLHVALLERDDQTRGVSLFSPVIESVKQLTRYAGAELDAAVISAFFTAFIKSQGDGDFLQDVTGARGAAPAEVERPVGFQTNAVHPTRQVKLGPALVWELEEGEDITFANPARPYPGFEPFFRAFCSIIGTATGLPHEILIKHFTSSYSASRGALLEAWRGFNAKRHLVMIDQFAQPVYEWVLADAIASGVIDAPGFFTDPLIRAAYTECHWTGPVMGQLNPLDEVNAALKKIDGGLSTIEEETTSMSGGDWERNHVQRVKEVTMRRRDGLDVEGVAERIVAEPATDGGKSTADDRDRRDQQEQRDARR